MADQRITQLTALAENAVAAIDVLPIVDISASETKKVTAKDLFEAGAALADSSSIDLIKLDQTSATKLATAAIADDAITAAKLANDSSINYGPTEPAADNFEGRGHVNSTTKYLKVYDGSVYQQVIAPTAGIEDLAVTTGKLAANAVTTAKVDASGLAAAALATDSVTTAKIQALAVTEAKIAVGAVTVAKLSDDAVTAAKLADDAVATASIIASAVTEAKIGASAVTEAKIGTGAVTETKIGAGAVTVAKIADTQITYAKLNLADGSVPGAKLVDVSVTAAKLGTDSVITAKINALAVTEAKIAAGAITETKIADDAITAAKIATNAVGALELANDAVDTASIVNSAVTEAKIGTGAVTVTKIADTSITYAKLNVADNVFPGAKLVDGSVVVAKLATDSVSTAKIVNDAVTTAKIADDAITADQLATGSVTADAIAADAVGASELADNAVDTAAIVNLAVTAAKLGDGAVTEAKIGTAAVTVAKIADATITYAKLNLADGSVPGAKIAADSIAAGQIAANAVNTSELVDGAVTTGKLANNAVTAGKIAVDAITANEIAAGAIGTSELESAAVTYAKIQNVSATDRLLGRVSAGAGSVEEITCTAAGRALLDDADATAQRATLGLGTLATQSATVTGTHSGTSSGSNTGDQTITLTGAITGTGTGSFATTITASAVTENAIATNAITNGKVLDGAITATKLAADSTTIVQAGTPVGSGVYEGQLWFDTNTSVKYVWNGSAWIRQAALNVINFSDTTPLNFAVAYPDNHTANITTTLDTQDANAVFIGPASGADAAPTFRALTPADLPDATASAKGIVQPGTGLAVNAGVLNHSNTVTPGTYTRLVVDAQGHISQGQLLEASDIPSLDAAKITTGGLPTDRLADAAVTIDKMADYSTASIGTEFPAATFTGQLHLNSLDRSFYMWDGNVWVPIGISAGQIVLAGTFDASSPAGVGKVQSVTPEGAAAGFVVNNALPVPTQGNNKHYFVVSEGGTITSGNAPAGVLAPPDLLLSVYNATLPQWVEIDVSAGAGAIAAANVSFVPAGDIAASNVQTAIEEVSTECRNATNITSGTLAVARGGTNVASYTKGDLLAASASTTLTKLPVGTNGQVLRANSATATGLEYGADFVGTVTTVTSSTAALTIATATTTPALTVRSATTSVDGIVQLSDSTSTTSSVLAATPTAVKSAYDLAAAALPKAGGTVTGDITLGTNVGIQFEGTTDDANEIRLIGADATADRTITLPNVTGTVITTGDSGTVTSTMILDGTILNADINASAAIAGTKVSPDFGSQTVVTTGVFSHALGAVGTPSITFTGDLNTGIFSPGADQLAVATNGTQSLLVDADGTVKVARGALVLGPVGGEGGELSLSNPTNTGTVYALDAHSATQARLYTTANNTDLSIGQLVGTGGTIKLHTGSTERARIDSDGRLLVGTSTAISSATGLQAFLQVQGTNENAYIHTGRWSADSSPPGLLFTKSRGGAVGTRGIVSNGDSIGEVGFYGDNGTTFNQAATVYAQIDGTTISSSSMPGRLVFATTASGAASPTERMRIASDGALTYTVNNEVLMLIDSSNSGSIHFSCTALTGTDNAPNAEGGIVHQNNGNTKVRGTSANNTLFQWYYYNNTSSSVGNITVAASSTSYNTSSDYRLKENVVDLDGAIARLNQLPVHRFNFIVDPDTVVDGFIAHEAAEVVPECVTGTKDEVDADGNPVYQGIDQSKMVPLLTAALQEAIAKIEALEQRLTAAGID